MAVTTTQVSGQDLAALQTAVDAEVSGLADHDAFQIVVFVDKNNTFHALIFTG